MEPLMCPMLYASTLRTSTTTTFFSAINFFSSSTELDFVQFVMQAQAPASQIGQSRRHFSMS